ncbi:major facilitator superfamily domain-containing protein [Aspergillus venezuelensis]
MHLERAPSNGLSREDEEFLANFPSDEKKQVIKKWRLMPMLVLLYLFAYIDKTNIGNARIDSLLPSLEMTGEQYNVALAIFFVPYVLAEVPSNIILNYFNKPSVYLGGLIFIWGVIMMCTGFVHDFSSLVPLGSCWACLSIAGFLTDAILIISKWCLPNETQTRIAILYTSAASGGAFSGLLAFGIAKMNGLAGYEGWRWIFIIEGIAKIVLAIMCFFLLIDSPSSNTSWLSPSEIRYLEARQIADSMQTQQRKAANNWPIIYPFSWRFPFIFVPQLLQVIAFSILFTHGPDIEDNVAVCYFGVYLACFGMYPILPGVKAWNVSNTPNPTKRAISIGYLICMGNVGGLIGSFIYKVDEAPRYVTGYGNSFAFAAAGIVACVVLDMVLLRINQQREGITENEVRARYSQEDIEELEEKSLLYRFTL